MFIRRGRIVLPRAVDKLAVIGLRERLTASDGPANFVKGADNKLGSVPNISLAISSFDNGLSGLFMAGNMPIYAP